MREPKHGQAMDIEPRKGDTATIMEQHPDLLTIAETARLLKVSVVTIKRWLRQGHLTAYRIGPRALRVRRSDLEALLSPTGQERARNGKEAEEDSAGTHQGAAVRRLSEEAARQQLEALKDSEGLLERMRIRRNGTPLPSSWRLIHQAREERARRL
jgi:excisionase family DNA binding protein